MTINREAWLKAIEATEEACDPDALTIPELSEMLGLKNTTTKERVKKLVAQGTAILTRKKQVDTTGRTQRVVAYRLIDPVAKKKKR